MPFSPGSKIAFERALEESRKLGMSYLAPEHIALALLASDDAAVHALLMRCVAALACRVSFGLRLRLWGPPW